MRREEIAVAYKPVNFAPIDKHAADAKEATRLDLEAHARLEAGLVDSFPPRIR
jgi:hypothetical protein